MCIMVVVEGVQRDVEWKEERTGRHALVLVVEKHFGYSSFKIVVLWEDGAPLSEFTIVLRCSRTP